MKILIRCIEQYVVSISVEMRIERKVSSKHEIGRNAGMKTERLQSLSIFVFFYESLKKLLTLYHEHDIMSIR